jgi:hypothetical protein
VAATTYAGVARRNISEFALRPHLRVGNVLTHVAAPPAKVLAGGGTPISSDAYNKVLWRVFSSSLQHHIIRGEGVTLKDGLVQCKSPRWAAEGNNRAPPLSYIIIRGVIALRLYYHCFFLLSSC